jgi:hypothetical protein
MSKVALKGVLAIMFNVAEWINARRYRLTGGTV